MAPKYRQAARPRQKPGPGALLGLLGLLAPAALRAESFALVTLNRLGLQPLSPAAAAPLPARSKDLPRSVQPYLKPTPRLDHLHPAVQRAAARVRRALAPGKAQETRLRQAPAVAAAARTWLDAQLSATAQAPLRAAGDERLAWPRASAILASGRASASERALAGVALLRALGVPARVAWARGELQAQYWTALARPKAARRGAKARRPPLGRWELLDPALRDEEVDAWSLDASSLARLRWKPAAQLDLAPLGWARAAFPGDLSAAAHAAFRESLRLGRLSGADAGRPLSLAAAAAGPGELLWVLSVQRWELSAEGALPALKDLQLLTPYRPHYASWGAEQRPAVRELELEAQGVWSGQAGRLKLRRRLQDEWASPPPALGVLHWYSLGLRAPEPSRP